MVSTDDWKGTESSDGDAPMMVSSPFITNWSLSDIGKPCRGPICLPLLRRWSSTSLARARARSMNISVRQFVFEIELGIVPREVHRDLFDHDEVVRRRS